MKKNKLTKLKYKFSESVTTTYKSRIANVQQIYIILMFEIKDYDMAY